MSFGFDVCVMILVRILSKIIMQTSYLKHTINPHKLHYKYSFRVNCVYVATEMPFLNNLETADLDLHGLYKIKACKYQTCSVLL